VAAHNSDPILPVGFTRGKGVSEEFPANPLSPIFPENPLQQWSTNAGSDFDPK